MLLKFSKRHILKTFSWRFLGSLDTFILSSHIIGNSTLGFQITGFELISKMILYYLHERIWFNSAFKNSNTRHLYKTISWRFIGTIDTVLLGWLITGDSAIGLKIGGVEILTKIILYYAHEKIWYRIDFGITESRKIKKS